MRKLFTNKYFILLMIVTVIILAIMTVFTTKRQGLSAAEDVTGAILMPVQKLFNSVTTGVGGMFTYFTDLDTLRKENATLNQRVVELQAQTRELETYRSENQRFRVMLDFKERLDYTAISSEVIARDPGTWFYTFTLDKGRAAGVDVNMEVATDVGLVGHIYEVGTNWSRAISILELGRAIGCLVTRTRDICVVEGDTLLKEEGLLRMTYIEKGGNVMVGDTLETSGVGTIYNKKGLLIGEVTEIIYDSTGMTQTAIVKPAVNFGKITEVFIISPDQPYDDALNTDAIVEYKQQQSERSEPEGE